jgi:O-methyltransferase involved in polyketide biosynthesis
MAKDSGEPQSHGFGLLGIGHHEVCDAVERIEEKMRVDLSAQGAQLRLDGFIAALPNGAEVVFDYSDPPDSPSPESRSSHDMRAVRVEKLGEPWVTHLEAEELLAKLLTVGFREVEDLGPPQIVGRYFPNRPISSEKGGHVVRAATA